MGAARTTLFVAVIYWSKREACTELTFVFLSRAKRIVDFIVEPMHSDRLNRLGQPPVLRAGLVEEVRLRLLAGQTRNGQRQYTTIVTAWLVGGGAGKGVVNITHTCPLDSALVLLLQRCTILLRAHV